MGITGEGGMEVGGEGDLVPKGVQMGGQIFDCQ